MDNDNNFYTTNISTAEKILNGNFTVEEIEYAIDCLKTNKTPGLDSIPAEVIKACKHVRSPTIATVFNYIIEHRDFPETWSCGTRSAVFKSGKRNIVDKFRGTTILPIMKKIFEAAAYKRIIFVNEAFEFCDWYNNGFLEGSRTSDNLYILNGLVERQSTMNKRLYLYYIDISKAFDMINRTILFYILIKNGWKGKVIDTFRSLYSKTHFRVKRNGKLSPPVLSILGVNQGGISSGLMFWKYILN